MGQLSEKDAKRISCDTIALYIIKHAAATGKYDIFEAYDDLQNILEKKKTEWDGNMVINPNRVSDIEKDQERLAYAFRELLQLDHSYQKCIFDSYTDKELIEFVRQDRIEQDIEELC